MIVVDYKNEIVVREEKKICKVSDLLSFGGVFDDFIQGKSLDDDILEISFGNVLPYLTGQFSKNFFKNMRLTENFEDELNLKVVKVGNGLFILSSLADSINADNMFNDMILEYGLWNAQGLNNHIHLCDYTSNVIVQKFLGYLVINTIVDSICKSGIVGSFVFYLNGKNDVTICVYSKVGVDDEFLKNFDCYLGMEDCYVTAISLNNWKA